MNSDASIVERPLMGKTDRETIASFIVLSPGGAPTEGVHPYQEKTGSTRSHSSPQLRENRTFGNTASGSRGAVATANRRISPGAAPPRRSDSATRLSRSISSDKETADWDASKNYRVCSRQGLGGTGRKMGEDYTDAILGITGKPNFSKTSSDSGSDVSSVVNGDIERIMSSNRYNKTMTNGVTKERDSQQEQEFSYGPGFVDKLKSRFINLSLQDKVKSGNALRRFSSLENVLDSDAEYPNTCNDVIKRKRPIGTANAWTRFNKSTPAKSGFKRAKSMETLLLESERKKIPSTQTNNAKNHQHRPVSMIETMPSLTLGLINENLVIIESPTKSVEIQPSPPATERPVILNTNNNNHNNNNGFSRTKSSKKNVNRQVSLISDEELPKPDIVKNCKLIFETVGKTVNANASAIVNNTRKVSAATIPRSAKNLNTCKNNANTLPKTFASSAKDIVNSEPLGKSNVFRDGTTRNENGESNSVSKEIVESKSVEDLELGNEEVKVNRVIPTSPVTEKISPSEPKTGAKLELTPSSSVTNGTVKHTVPRPPSLITGKVPIEEKLKDIAPSPHEETKETSKVGSPIQGIPNSRLNSKSDETNNTPSVTSPSPVEEAVKDDDVLKPSTLLGNKKPGLWQKAPQMTTTIVYDFRGKDVKSHLPSNPAPFGCAPSRVKKPKKSQEGLTLRNGIDLGDFGGGESNDYDSDDEYDGTDVGANLPAKSGINFVGENTKCNKSSLLATKNKRLKIQFDDDATSTFEYPSEDWIYDETPSLLSSGTNLLDTVLSPDNQRPQPTDHQENGEIGVSNTALRNTPGLNPAGGLSNYTPSMLSSTESSFQLGVSRVQKEEPMSSTPKNGEAVDSSISGARDDDEDLLPADPEQTSSWSSSTSTSDLLF